MFYFDPDASSDPFTEEGDPFKAVAMSPECKWVVGYGVTIEIAPYPKSNFRFLAWFGLGTVVTVETDFGNTEVPNVQRIDFSPLCEFIYRGLCDRLVDRINKSPMTNAIGFVHNGSTEMQTSSPGDSEMHLEKSPGEG
jgi:hypothetical protein